MSTKAVVRTVRCDYCDAESTVPSRRGPAPSYCSAAHRQAAYRQRRRDEGRTAPPRPGQLTLRDEVGLLQAALAEIADVARWSTAREVLGARLSTLRQQSPGSSAPTPSASPNSSEQLNEEGQ